MISYVLRRILLAIPTLAWHCDPGHLLIVSA